MRRTVQRRTAVGFIALLALFLPLALPAAASESSGDDDVIVLQGAKSAEGIAAGEGTTFFAGELNTGDIFRGDIREGKAKRIIDAPEGRMAVGMKADVSNDLLFVAGGATGKAYVYNTETRKTVAEVTLTTKTGSFINDVTLTDDGAWFTNSKYGELYLVKVSHSGEVRKAVRTLTVKGDAASALGPNDFGMNGIAVAEDGDTLIVAHTRDEALYAVDPETGKSDRIKGRDLEFIDGILVKGHTLWAVQNMDNQISRVELSDDLSSFKVEDVIKSKNFDIPTTVAKFGDTLAAVNAKFGRQAARYEVVLVPAWD
ncbi:SMP-30/gluconolactonase/LRE family protein [Arthrobacter sp. W4I7]|uniref:SMP-30/gluconolactonase/LRE family protein n=1 Tax=Arthrobacter sp. W4I7 TaxID=3042296 RepID=UPI00277D5929|nr:SMP-30/gluconolactonase/LRE family protein [Arthrobacter sp. W4I7]MDQ0689309.1 sugar lactone lactonase YvrE [Arthrobacter sp. W4I7]